MPPRMDDSKRQQILEAVTNANGRSRNDIAREFGVSGSTVGRIADEAGVQDAWDRTNTEKGTQARSADLAELRSRTAARFLQKANEMLDRLEEPCEVFAFGGAENRFNSEILHRPPSAEARNLMTAAAIALDKHVLLDKHDADDSGGAAVDAWLRHVMGSGTTQM